MKKLFIFFLTLIICSVLASAQGFTPPLASNFYTINGSLVNFTNLQDTPSSYSGSNSYCVTVNAGATALVFTPCTGISWANAVNGTLLLTSTFNSNYSTNDPIYRSWLNNYSSYLVAYNFATNHSYLFNNGDTATGNYTFGSKGFFIDGTNNNINFLTTNNTYQFQVKGYGTTNQKYWKIQTGGASYNQLLFESGASGHPYLYLYNGVGSPKVLVNTNGASYFNGGNFGIGGTPAVPLHVITTGTTPFRLERTGVESFSWVITGGNPDSYLRFDSGDQTDLLRLYERGDVVIPDGNLTVTGFTNSTLGFAVQGTIGYTGYCINITYTGGIATSCND